MPKFRFFIAVAAIAVAALLLSFPALAVEVELTIESLTPEDGAFLTPVWVGFHAGNFDVYDRGASAALFPGLESIAEDGNSAPLAASFLGQVAGGVETTIAGPGGPLFAGDRVTRRFNLDPATHRYFSYTSMVIPSNDAFIANGNPLAHRVFDPNGQFTPFEFYVVGSEVLDACTEVNDEVPANVAALGQAAPNTGVDENGTVELHPGFMAGGAILDARPNGDFTLPGYRLLKVSLRAVPTDRVYFGADAAQEVPTNDSTAIAACHAELNAGQTQLTFSCEHNVAEVAAAHVHLGAPGENGDVVFPFDDPASPFSQSFDVTAEQVETFFAGNYYVNIHSATYPAGEIRGQVDGCFEGPSGLCLNDDRFQVTVQWETADGDSGSGRAVEGTADSGFFTFFSEDNIELDIKVLDGCGFNDYFWVFTAGTTNVGVDITVEDTVTGQIRTYDNAIGNTFETILDTAAFAVCP